MKNKLPYVDLAVQATVALTNRDYQQVLKLIHTYTYGRDKIPLSEEVALDHDKAIGRLGMDHLHTLTIRCYADGTQELLGPGKRNRAEMRRRQVKWAHMRVAPKVFR